MRGETHGLLDTNILILRREIDHAELPDIVSISAITLAELSAGPHHTDDPRERARRLDVLQRTEAEFDPLPFDAEAARAFGRVSAAVLATGRKPRGRVPDLMIASVAIAHRLPLFTTNPGDFEGLQDLLAVMPVKHPHTG
ncbi:VapC toxin family PIN domain ribonuclease [Actinomadura craniellae]|uniref:Ribonuclease VapC n=1 Tax=Actinomadura craniellae TaxID=2231787 RepID=A0A365H9U5_9ACTN|nr:type II toxin-antitoxin system VapC family toxin [Actinomadura craniellae]RAY15910.1 VapC toxin family PIN domain ribonuclease [Actinomadura craniellae]